MSLVEEAQKIIPKRDGKNKEWLDDEHFELAKAYWLGKVTYAQAAKVLGQGGSNLYNFLSRMVTYGIEKGKIKFL